MFAGIGLEILACTEIGHFCLNPIIDRFAPINFFVQMGVGSWVEGGIP